MFIVYGLQLLLNALWSWLFFGAHRMGWALVEIVVLWLTILLTTVLFARRSVTAAAGDAPSAKPQPRNPNRDDSGRSRGPAVGPGLGHAAGEDTVGGEGAFFARLRPVKIEDMIRERVRTINEQPMTALFSRWA